MKNAYFAGAAAVAGLIIAWYAYPWTKSQCMAQAAQMPTEAGVRVKLMQCNRDFRDQ